MPAADPSADPAPAAATTPAVVCRDLVVRYGPLTAVDQLSLEAAPGEVLALLGPNGAGKTSTVESLEGYRRPASGHLRVLGLDPWADRAQLLPRMGVMLQRGGIYPMLNARQALRLFASYYDEPEDVEALLGLVALEAVAQLRCAAAGVPDRARVVMPARMWACQASARCTTPGMRCWRAGCWSGPSPASYNAESGARTTGAPDSTSSLPAGWFWQS